MIDGTWGMPDGWGSVVLFGDVAVPPQPPPIVIPPPPPIIPTGCVCGITDAFGRTVSAGWGTSDAGLAWNVFYDVPIDTGASVDGAVATLFASDEFSRNGGARDADLVHTALGSTTALIKMRIRPSTYPVLEGFTNVDIGFGATAPDIVIRIWDDSTAQERGTAGATAKHALSGVNVTEWFWARIELSTTVYRWRAWNDGNAEPGTWMNGIAWSGYSDGFMEFDLSPTRFSGVDPDGFGDITLLVDSVDITGLDKCSEFRWDNFNRSVVSGFGTGDLGEAWTLYFSNNGSSSVDGSNGILSTNYGGGFFGAERMRVLGQISHWTKSLFNPLVVTDAFTISARLIPAPLPSGQSAGAFMETIVDICSVLHLIVHTETSGSTFYIQENGSPTKFDSLSLGTIPANTYYTMRMEVTPTDLRGKVWKDGDPEPDWQLQVLDWPTGQDTSSATGDYLEAALQSGLTAGSFETVTAKIDYIDFDYAGKPCYGTSHFDDFARTGSGEWGTTPAGYVWTRPFPSGYTVLVDGTVGVLSVSAFGGDTFELNDPAGPWANPAGVTMTLRMRVNGAGAGGGGSPPEVFLYFNGSVGFPSLDLAVGGSNNLFLSDGANDSQNIATTFIADSYFFVKWERVPGGLSRGKVWQDGDAEPGWQVQLAGPVSSGLPTGFGIDLESHSSLPNPLTFNVDWIDFA